MLIENKCVPCTWIQMMTNVCFFSSFSFFKCSGVHLSVHWELWTSCKCLCKISGVNVRPDSVSSGYCSGDGIQKRQILGAAASLARGLSEGDPTDMPVPCSEPRLSVDRRVKAEILLMTFELFTTWLLCTHWAFGFFFTPLAVSHFPGIPCVCSEVIPSNQNLLEFTHVRWAYPPGSNGNITASRKTGFLFWEAPLYILQVPCTPLWEHVSQCVLNAVYSCNPNGIQAHVVQSQHGAALKESHNRRNLNLLLVCLKDVGEDPNHNSQQHLEFPFLFALAFNFCLLPRSPHN